MSSNREDLLGWGGNATRGERCDVDGCLTNPIAVRDGRPLCGKHRDIMDHSTLGRPCDQCGSRNWIATPDAASVAICVGCDYVTYDETVLADSW